MHSSYVDAMEKVRRAAEAMDSWPAGQDAAPRAEATAALLRSLWPRAALFGCVLRRHGREEAAVLDEKGGARPDWAPAIRDAGLRSSAERPATPPGLNLKGHVLVLQSVRCGDCEYGALALAVTDADAAERDAARGFLTTAGMLLGGRMPIDGMAESAAVESRLADIGEVAAPVAHEFNNFLNALLLHVAVLLLQLPPETHPGLGDVRRQAMSVAELIQRFQNYRRRSPSASIPGDKEATTADLNRAVRAAVAGMPSGAPLRLDLTGEVLTVAGADSDLKHLCRFLMRNAVGAVAATGGGVVVRTARAGDRIVLRVEDGGRLPPEAAARLFEPSGPARDGVDSLEMAASRNLARRLQAAIHVEAPPEGGVAVVVEWDMARSTGGRRA